MNYFDLVILGVLPCTIYFGQNVILGIFDEEEFYIEVI
jgi:hypothetical protein